MATEKLQWRQKNSDWHDAQMHTAIRGFEWLVPGIAAEVRMVKTFQEGYYRKTVDEHITPQIYLLQSEPDDWNDGAWKRLELDWKDAA